MKRLYAALTVPFLCAIPAPARALTCDVSGSWTIIHQSPAVARMTITQDGSGGLSGSGVEGQNAGQVVEDQSSIEGRNVTLVIKWTNGHIGEYNGTVGLNGRISGVNHDQTAPSSQQLFNVREKFQCAR